MSLYATAILLLATAVLERDAWSSMPSPRGNAAFYAGLLCNCTLAMASNFLNISVTRATSPLTLQVLILPVLAQLLFHYFPTLCL